jgi:PAS domain S-box-containing protein
VPEPLDNPPPAIRWHRSIRFRLAVGLLGLLAVLVGSSMAIIWLRGMPLLQEQRHQLNETIGRNLVNTLRQHFSQAQAVSRSLAHLAETLPADDPLMRRVIPRVLDNTDLRNLIAGGGLWPEPHTFKPEHERHSFFWGRNAHGELAFYNGYNDPAGPGYHQEEWYVPAKHQQGSDSYWSRSYTDPYSLQPMVTCTTPYFIAEKFAGVVTVDLRLEGVHALIQQTFKQQPGYAFVVDRNDKFIAFPDMSLVITRRQDEKGKAYQDYIFAAELALQKPVFAPIADRLALVSHRNASLANRDSDEVKKLADHIAGASYQIDKQEARVIAHNLSGTPPTDLELLAQFQAGDDLLLRTAVDVAIYQMPHTFWKIVAVFPVSETTRTASAISRSLSWITLAGTAVWGLLLFYFIWRVFFRPLRRMTNRVMRAARENREIVLDHPDDDELGQFAYWYNLRTHQLNDALEEARQVSRKLSSENREHQLTATLLEKSLAMQQAILDSANLIIISTDTAGMILTCNAGTEKLLGFREEELIGKTFPHQLIDRAQLQHYQDTLLARYGTRVGGFDLFITAQDRGDKEENEWLMTRKDGSHCNVLLSVTPVLNPSHEREGWLAVASDITQRKQAEEDLKTAMLLAERSSRAKTHFLANMSHELRTPLNAILGFTRRLQKKLLNQIESRHMDALDTIERSANHLMALINDLLDISKIEAGQMDLQITEFDLVKLMEEIHEETRPLAEGRPIDYSCHLPSQPVLILADRMKLRQIIFNLLSNSFKATEHGAIDIQLSAPHADHSITLKVSDTGKGISPEDSRKLFQKFSNLDTYVDGKASTGLGLYLTLQLVKMHNGNISFESTPGKGTCFTVKLPLRLQTVDEVEAQT